MARRLIAFTASLLPMKHSKAKGVHSKSGTPLKWGAWGLSLLLYGCALFQPSTEDVLKMQDKALLAYDKGENAQAEALYLGLIKQAPNDAEAWLRLGNLYARSGHPDNAAEAYLRALLLTPNDERLWYNLGVVRQRQAQASFIQANQLTADNDPLRAKSAAHIKQLESQLDSQTFDKDAR